VPFRFSPVSLQLDTRSLPDTDSPFKMLIDGTIRGRVTPNGTVQVALQPHLRSRFRDASSGISSGVKTFLLKAEETVALELPSEGGYVEGGPDVAANIGNPRPGVSITDKDRVRVDKKQFFAGAKTSLILTVHR